MRDLTNKEAEVLHYLKTAWNSYLELPIVHNLDGLEYKSDRLEFINAIHTAQHIVMSRPVMEGPAVTFDTEQR